MNGAQTLPVHVLTGFLGAGKTSLLRRLLASPTLADTAVLINEFGEVGLDHLLVEELDEDVVLLASGCVCCTVRADLKDGLVRLMEKRRAGQVPAFARVVLETTGIADPAPIVSTLATDPMLRHQVRLGGIVTVVDVPNGAANLATHAEASRQIAAADRLVISKSELAGVEASAALAERLAALNPTATQILSTQDTLPSPDLLLGEAAGEPFRSKAARHWIEQAVAQAGRWRFHGHSGHDSSRHGDIRAFVVHAEIPLDWSRLALWLSMLLNRHGAHILRLKGLVQLAGVAGPVVLQGVQHILHPPEHLEAWREGGAATRIVLIAKGIDPALVQRSFEAFVLPAAKPGGAEAGGEAAATVPH